MVVTGVFLKFFFNQELPSDGTRLHSNTGLKLSLAEIWYREMGMEGAAINSRGTSISGVPFYAGKNASLSWST